MKFMRKIIYYNKNKVLPKEKNSEAKVKIKEVNIEKYNLENVYYINLQTRKDRKEHIEKELDDLGWKYKRFDAVRDTFGILGCGKSHLKLLEEARDKKLEYIVVLEDDFVCKNKNLLNKNLKRFFDEKLEYDVLCLGGNLFNFKRNNDYLIKPIKIFSTVAYIVNNKYFDKLIENFKQSILLLEKTKDRAKYSIDVYWNKIIPLDNWLMPYPLTISQLRGFSNIENRTVNYDKVMLKKI